MSDRYFADLTEVARSVTPQGARVLWSQSSFQLSGGSQIVAAPGPGRRTVVGATFNASSIVSVALLHTDATPGNELVASALMAAGRPNTWIVVPPVDTLVYLNYGGLSTVAGILHVATIIPRGVA